jgi:hypothetical protein
VDLAIEFWLPVTRAVLLATAFIGFAWALLRMRRESRIQLERVYTAQRELSAQLHTLSERSSALATLVATLPNRAERANEAPRPALRREPAQVRSYESARRMARAGASIDEIVASSGLASSEARLLRRLHGSENDRSNAAL